MRRIRTAQPKAPVAIEPEASPRRAAPQDLSAVLFTLLPLISHLYMRIILMSKKSPHITFILGLIIIDIRRKEISLAVKIELRALTRL